MSKYGNIVAKYLSEKKDRDIIHVKLNNHRFLDILNNDDAHKYDPTYVPSISSYVNDTKYPYKIVIGAYGSGKTSCFINALLREAVLMPKCDDGVRKCKIAIIRNTAGQLETTTLASWLFWTAGLPTPQRKKVPQLTYHYRFRDDSGLIELDVLFLALDNEQTIRKLDSLELTHAFFNEIRHVSKKIYYTAIDRCGRYPSRIEFINKFEALYPKLSSYFCSKYPDKVAGLNDLELRRLIFRKWRPFQKKVYADTNAPKNRHWICNLEKSKPKEIKIYHQPEALLKNKKGEFEINPNADNLAFVGEKYYLDMIDRGEEYVKVYAQGKYGTIVDGKPVYPYYNDDRQSVEKLPLIKDETLYIGCDYGSVSPAVLITQFIDGQIRALKEFCGEYQTIKSLWSAFVNPFLNLYCEGMPLIIVGDPANTGDGIGQLNELGFYPEPCCTNKIDSRISAVSNALQENVCAEPRLIISRHGCPVLREGMLGEYHYRYLHVVGEEKLVDTPDKTHPHSDIQDCLQYITIKILGDVDRIRYTQQEEWYRPKYQEEKDRSRITGY